MFPLARRDAITARELGDELLVYDHAKNKAHSLNAVSALIWRHCDGATSEAKLIALVEEKLQVADAASVVSLALEQLSRRDLLLKPVKKRTQAENVSRRDALRKLVAAAIVLPVIATMTPKAWASTTVSTSLPCPPGTFECFVIQSSSFGVRLCCESATEVCTGSPPRCSEKPAPPPPPPPPPPPDEGGEVNRG